MNDFIASRDPSTSLNLSRPEVCLVMELERFAIHTKKGDEKASITSCSGWFPSLKNLALSGVTFGTSWFITQTHTSVSRAEHLLGLTLPFTRKRTRSGSQLNWILFTSKWFKRRDNPLLGLQRVRFFHSNAKCSLQINDVNLFETQRGAQINNLPIQCDSQVPLLVCHMQTGLNIDMLWARTFKVKKVWTAQPIL